MCCQGARFRNSDRDCLTRREIEYLEFCASRMPIPPLHDDVKLASLRILEHLVDARTLVAALGTADTGIVILLDYLPAPPVGDTHI